MTVSKTKTKKPVTKKIVDKVEDIVADVKAEANEDVATFTIDKWHVLLAAIVVTVTALVIIL